MSLSSTLRAAPGYPKAMVHPNGQKGSTRAVEGVDTITGRKFIDYQGTPDRFPNVHVNDAHQEAFYRARGYLEYGEKAQPMSEYNEYPLWMKKAAAGGIEFEDKLARSPQEEEILAAQGYVRPGKFDPDAIEAATAVPYVPGRVDSEYPKWVNGVLVDPDAEASGFEEYPKWVGDTLVADRGEETEARARQGMSAVEVRAVPARISLRPTIEDAPPANPAREALIRRAVAAGCEVDDGWTDDQIIDAMLARASAPAPVKATARPRKVHLGGGRPGRPRKAKAAEPRTDEQPGAE